MNVDKVKAVRDLSNRICDLYKKSDSINDNIDLTSYPRITLHVGHTQVVVDEESIVRDVIRYVSVKLKEKANELASVELPKLINEER